jgi:hypothetical protein
MRCDHRVALVGNIDIQESGWDAGVRRYARLLASWYALGEERPAVRVPRPGSVVVHNFCPDCGRRLDDLKVRALLHDAYVAPMVLLGREEYVEELKHMESGA